MASPFHQSDTALLESPEAQELRQLIGRLEKVVARLEELECNDEDQANQGGTEGRA
jgi:hypothetical protein